MQVQDGYICNFLNAPIVMAADGATIVGDYSSNYAGLVHFHPCRLADCLADARYIDGLVVPIADDVQVANIYHWISDWLPRLAFLGPRVRDHDVFVVTAEITADFQRESLRLCGVDADRIVPVGNFAAIRARELVVPSNLGQIVHPAFSAAPWALSYLRSTLGLAALQAEAASAGGDRIYISRRDANGRQVRNEAEMMALLGRSGYRELVLSGLPLIEQIATIARAKRLVGVHGAGLIHFAFSPPGARLLEILPKSYAIPGYPILAAGLGNDYLSYVAEQVIPGINPSFDDITIDIADFERCCRDFYE